MPTPMVSVLIPCYNSRRFVSRAIKSALNQTYKDLEIIVVDDGSSDGTFEYIVEHFPNVTIAQQANSGASAARNHAASLAKGTYYAFLDSDDAWHPQKLELQMQYVAADDSCLVATMGSSDPKILNTTILLDDITVAEIPFDELFISPYLGTPNVLLNADKFQAIGGFNEKLRTAEDLELFLRYCYAGNRVVRLLKPMCHISTREQSLSDSPESYDDHIHMLSQFLSDKPNLVSDRVLNQTIAGILTKKSRFQHNIGDWKGALLTQIKSIRMAPSAERLVALLYRLVPLSFRRRLRFLKLNR